MTLQVILPPRRKCSEPIRIPALFELVSFQFSVGQCLLAGFHACDICGGRWCTELYRFDTDFPPVVLACTYPDPHSSFTGRSLIACVAWTYSSSAELYQHWVCAILVHGPLRHTSCVFLHFLQAPLGPFCTCISNCFAGRDAGFHLTILGAVMPRLRPFSIRPCVSCNRASHFGCVMDFSVKRICPVPNKHIGGSGVLTEASLFEPTPVQDPGPCVADNPGIDVLLLLMSCIMPFARSLLFCLSICLLHMYAIGWKARPTPLGRVCGYFFQRVPRTCVRCLGATSPSAVVLDWSPYRDKRGRTWRPKSRHSQPVVGRNFLALCFFFGHLPVQVWAAPKHIRLLHELGEAVCLVGIPHVFSEAPDELPATASVPRREVPDFVDRNLQAPAGPPPPQPLRVTIDNTVQHTRPADATSVSFPAWIAAAGFQPDIMQLQISVPCDIEDAVDTVARAPFSQCNPSCDRIIAVRPQPFPTCAAFLRAPDWLSYSSLSLVCLDLRDTVPGGTGPVVAAYVTRPTSLAELQREAGAYGVADARVYVGTDVTPFQDDESIVLSSGCLVTFMCTDRCPYVANDLQYRLQFPKIWSIPAQFPVRSRTRASLLLLHASGRYLLGSRPNDITADEAAARFIAVPRASVAFHAPRGHKLQDFIQRRRR